MKRVIVIFLCAVLLLTGSSMAYSLKKERILTKESIQKMLGKKIFAPDLAVISNGKGNLLIPARDYKTRVLEWYLIDPFKRKILKNGEFPFRVYTQLTLSPDEGGILAFSRYPTAIWYLNMNTGEWHKVYENPAKGKEGYAILDSSPLTYTEATRAFTMMDLWDKEHFTLETFMISLNIVPFKIERVASMKALRTFTVKKIMQTIPLDRSLKAKGLKDMMYYTGAVRLGEDKRIAYIMGSYFVKNKRRVDYQTHLCVLESPKKIEIIDTIRGKIFPLDYKSDTTQILYRTFDGKKVNIVYFDGKKKKVLNNSKALVGKIMAGNLIGLASVDGKSLVIYLGDGTKLNKAATLKKMYRVGFINNGKRIILLNTDEVVCFSINKD